MFCRGTIKEKIFEPWAESLETKGCEMLEDKKVTDFIFNEETGCITEVVCGKETYSADAVILAVGISTLQEIIKKRFAVSGPSLHRNMIQFPVTHDTNLKSILLCPV